MICIFPRYNRELGKPFSLNADKVIKFFESEGIERLKANATAQVTNTLTTSTVVDSTKAVKIAEKPVDVIFNKAAEISKEESNADFLASLNEPVKKEEPIIPKVTSQLEANFMAEKKVATPFTDILMVEGSDIVTTPKKVERLPWEPEEDDMPF